MGSIEPAERGAAPHTGMKRMNVDALRAEFPVLDRQINGRPIVYLDNACMTLKPECVVEAMVEYYRRFPGCGGLGRSTHTIGREVDDATYQAREALRRFINARPAGDDWIDVTPTREIIFTRNATEAMNLVAQGFPFSEGAAVLTTDREHNSNLCPWQDLEQARGVRHLWVPSEPGQPLDLDAYEAILARENVELVSMVHVSNLDGTKLPAAEVIELAHEHGARVLLDAAQSAPHMPLDVQALNVDFLALSLHKLCGPTGVGALYAREEILANSSFRPLLSGGDTVEDTALGRPPAYLEPPFRFEAGLQDYAGIIGAGAAIDFIERVGTDEIGRHVDALNTHLAERLEPLADEFEVLGSADPKQRHGMTTLVGRRRGVVSLWEEGISGIGSILNHWANIMVRTGEFCVHSWFAEHGISREREKLRASLYAYNTIEDCDALADALE
ncbi:MAG: aminotransferase class V-fold PLP-dependent enzyme, partial [Armatimonadia bacterium]|nr:aminotransferase class V-fold PLP-dependent enzyme [Armatimonadia bacterium]